MTHENGYKYPRVKIRDNLEAYRILEEEATYYGKSVGEFVADLAITWTKMLKGESNPYWPVMFQPMSSTSGNGQHAPVPEAPSLEEARKRREAEELEVKQRKAARLAAARAELNEDK